MSSVRYWSHVNKDGGYPDFTDPLVRINNDAGQCWIWTGYTAPNGYGNCTVDGVKRYAHHVTVPDVPEGFHRDHLCRRKNCVNPDHIQVVTAGENTRRGIKGQQHTHCKRGHEMTGDNVHTRNNGKRVCRTCAKERYIREHDYMVTVAYRSHKRSKERKRLEAALASCV